MKDLRCLIGRHDWRTTHVLRFCSCDWPDIEQDTKVPLARNASEAAAAWCDATVAQRCNRCPESRHLWARRRTPGNPPAWTHALTGGVR